MSGVFSRVIYAVAAAACLFGSAVASLAQEKTAGGPSGVSSSQPDAIAEAKKDFERLKSSHDAALQPKGELPRVSVPDWQGASPPLTGSAVRPKAPIRESKPANWLVDAMEKQPSSRPARRGGEHERELTGESDRELGPMSRDRTREAKDSPDERRPSDSRDEKNRRNSLGAVDPLARYLEDWMTPQDYALLKPGLTDSVGSAAAGKVSAALTGFGHLGTGVSLAGSDLASGSIAPARPVFAPPLRENPYLQSLGNQEFSAQIVATQPKPATLAPSPAMPPAVFVPPPVTTSPSKIPEFAKPATDDKYFKPLKRF